MSEITIQNVLKEKIDCCRDLCNQLMAYQKSQALIAAECFDEMNFDTRMKKSVETAERSQVLVASCAEKVIGYVFSTIDNVAPEDRTALPAWAPIAENSVGFYPEWLELPQKVGCLNNLYVCEEYRSSGIGYKLLEQSMQWLESFPDVDYNFVYISNGNQGALNFYLRNGFIYSHEVFGGFITAAYKKVAR